MGLEKQKAIKLVKDIGGTLPPSAARVAALQGVTEKMAAEKISVNPGLQVGAALIELLARAQSSKPDAEKKQTNTKLSK